jgi:hypothetical protein
VPGIPLNVGYRTDRQEIGRGRYDLHQTEWSGIHGTHSASFKWKPRRPDDARRLRASIEALSNLIYLASREAKDPERVRTYLKLAEKQVAALGHTLG